MKNKLTVFKDNRVIEAGYKLSKLEQCLILYAVAKSNPKKFDRKVNFSVKDFLEMFPNFSPKHIYTQLKEAVDSLYERSITVDNPIYKAKFRWVSSAYYFKDKATISVNFTEEIEPYLSDLSCRYTKYKLVNISNFKSDYSFRIYELLTQYRSSGSRKISIDELRKMLMIEDKYQTTKSLNQLLLKPCIDEINQYSDLKITYKPLKQGVKITGYKFEIKSDKMQEIEQQIEESTHEEINKIIKNKVAENIEKEKTSNTENLNLYLSIIKALEQSEQGLINLAAKEINLLIKFEKSFHKNNRRFIFKSEEQKNYLMGVLSKKGTLKNHIQDNKTQEENEKKKQAKEEKINSIELKAGMILVGSATQNEYLINEFCAVIGADYKHCQQDFLSVGVNPIDQLKELVACDKLKIK